MTISTDVFKNKSYDSQHCFRQILTVMSEPALIRSLDRSHGFGGMGAGMAQVLQTLCDTSTRIMLSPVFASDSDVTDNVAFHVESPVVGDRDQTDFCVIAQADLAGMFGDFAQFPQGNFEYPETGTTFVIEVSSLTSGASATLTGPGIETSRDLFLGDVPDGFMAYLETRVPKFPTGPDFIFTCGNDIAALPRTTQFVKK